MRMVRARVIPLVVLSALLALAVSASGCSKPKDASAPKPQKPAVAPAPAGPADIESFKEEVQTKFGNEAWFGNIKSIEETSVLGAPIIAVFTDVESTLTLDKKGGYYTSEWGDVPHSIATALAGLEPTFSGQVEIYGLAKVYPDDPKSDTYPSSAEVTPTPGAKRMTQKYKLPTAPQTVDDLLPWLQKVYGPGGVVPLAEGERWLPMIKSIRLAPYEWEGGAKRVIVETTYLYGGNEPFNDGRRISAAIQASGCLDVYKYGCVMLRGDNGGNGKGTSFSGWQPWKQESFPDDLSVMLGFAAPGYPY